jgi:hypothetical protein
MTLVSPGIACTIHSATPWLGIRKNCPRIPDRVYGGASDRC